MTFAKDLPGGTKSLLDQSAKLLRKPASAKRMLPLRYRLLLGAGGVVLAIVAIAVRRALVH